MSYHSRCNEGFGDGIELEVRKFDSTAWSVVMAAQGGKSVAGRAALEALCATYWPPLYTYVRLKGYGREDAEDLTQEFFARFLSRDFLQTVDRKKGRFRTFLLACLDHFVSDEWRKGSSLKRGGREQFIPIDFIAGEEQFAEHSRLHLGPAEAFDRQWAENVLEAAGSCLKREYEAAGKGSLFACLSPYLSGDDGSQGYSDVARSLGMSEGAVKVAVHRLRRRFAALARRAIADTVTTEEQINEELAYLIRVIST